MSLWNLASCTVKTGQSKTLLRGRGDGCMTEWRMRLPHKHEARVQRPHTSWPAMAATHNPLRIQTQDPRENWLGKVIEGSTFILLLWYSTLTGRKQLEGRKGLSQFRDYSRSSHWSISTIIDLYQSIVKVDYKSRQALKQECDAETMGKARAFHSPSSLQRFLCVDMCVLECVYLYHVCADASRGQKRVLYLIKLEL